MYNIIQGIYYILIYIIERDRERGVSKISLKNHLFLAALNLLLLCVAFLQLWQVEAALHCGARASHCCRPQALGAQASVAVASSVAVATTGSVVAACGLWSAGSAIVVHGPGFSMPCRIFPDQALDSCPLHWQMDSYPMFLQGHFIYIYIQVTENVEMFAH